jgi:hypothetical protein
MGSSLLHHTFLLICKNDQFDKSFCEVYSIYQLTLQPRNAAMISLEAHQSVERALVVGPTLRLREERK